MSHVPVLLKEVIDSLNLQPGNNVIDGTLGAGGHSLAILKKIGKSGGLLAIDQDPQALKIAKKNLKKYQKQIIYKQANFSKIKNLATEQGFKKVNAILLDLGVSSMQFDNPERGFSLQQNSLLDMRMGETELTAERVVNDYSFIDLTKILESYGDFKTKEARLIAELLVRQRQKQRITTTKQLVELLKNVSTSKKKSDVEPRFSCVKTIEDRQDLKQKIHPRLYRVFQALRIEVNAELLNLAEALPQLASLLVPGGRMAIISFHSGEDRLVKKFLKNEARKCICPDKAWICTCQHQPSLKIITKKPIIPTVREIQNNPRSRSAKLRVAEKI